MESGKRARHVLLTALLLVTVTAACWAQREAPAESIARAQDMYGRLRDKLWEVNDGFWHEGDYERCIAMLRLITAMDPHDTEAYSNGAWLMQNQLRDDEAEAYLLEGLANNTDVFSLYFDLGYYYYMHERFPEAIDKLENVLIFDDAPDVTWHVLAHTYEHAGLVSESLSIWFLQEAIEPGSYVPRLQIDRILAGEPPTIAPEMARHAREQRMKDERR